MIIYFWFVALPLLLFLALVYLEQNHKKFKPRPKRKKNKPPRSRGSLQTHSPLQAKFLAMLGGDAATAQRLIEHEKQLNPGHFENWYIEKAIWRLERDRR